MGKDSTPVSKRWEIKEINKMWLIISYCDAKIVLRTIENFHSVCGNVTL